MHKKHNNTRSRQSSSITTPICIVLTEGDSKAFKSPTSTKLAWAVMVNLLYRSSFHNKEGQCRGVETVASMLFESVSEYGVSCGSGGLRNTRIT